MTEETGRMSKKALEAGVQAPDFCLPDQEGKETCLVDFQGQWVVLYFYPRDNTPGCTIEAIDFTGVKKDLEAKNTVIFGVSPDSSQSHQKFVAKQSLTLTLLSDPDREVIEAYGAWQLKKMYGKESWGVVRSTYLINPQGKIAFVWPHVKAKGHVENVVQKITELQ
jgi:thioredoxin-dependent peroxiredoxin